MSLVLWSAASDLFAYEFFLSCLSRDQLLFEQTYLGFRCCIEFMPGVFSCVVPVVVAGCPTGTPPAATNRTNLAVSFSLAWPRLAVFKTRLCCVCCGVVSGPPACWPAPTAAASGVHLLPAVAIQSVDFSVQSSFMPDSSGAFTKAYLEMHALKTSSLS